MWRYRSTMDVKVDTPGCVLGENVADLRFGVGVKRLERSAVEAELVVVVLLILNLESEKKTCQHCTCSLVLNLETKREYTWDGQ